MDIAAPPVLAKFVEGDEAMDVVVAIGKTGNVYVVDRDSGKSFSRHPLSKNASFHDTRREDVYLSKAIYFSSEPAW